MSIKINFQQFQLENVLKFYLFAGLLSFALFISGCSDNDNVVNTSQITQIINGKVTDYYGNGQGNITVESKVGITKTASDGSFSFSNIIPPYDISVYTNGMNVITYRNISTTKPQLPINNNVNIYPYESRVNVIVPPMNTNQKSFAQFFDNSGMFMSDVTITSASAQMDVEWNGSQNISGKMALWVYNTDNFGNFLSYEKYGEKPISLSNGVSGRIVFYDIDLNTNPADSSISGNVVLSQGSVIEYAYIGMNRFPFANMYEYGHSSKVVNISGSNFSASVPALNGGIYNYYLAIKVYEQSSHRAGYKIAQIYLNNSNIVGINTFPTLFTPEDGAQNINYNSIFSFSKDSPAGIYEFRLEYTNNSNFLIFRSIFTDSESLNITALSDTAFNIAENSDCSWNIVKYSGFSNLDDYLSIPPAKNPKFREWLTSDERSFKFKK